MVISNVECRTKENKAEKGNLLIELTSKKIKLFKEQLYVVGKLKNLKQLDMFRTYVFIWQMAHR